MRKAASNTAGDMCADLYTVTTEERIANYWKIQRPSGGSRYACWKSIDKGNRHRLGYQQASPTCAVDCVSWTDTRRRQQCWPAQSHHVAEQLPTSA